jgi:hypothetical protein
MESRIERGGDFAFSDVRFNVPDIDGDNVNVLHSQLLQAVTQICAVQSTAEQRYYRLGGVRIRVFELREGTNKLRQFLCFLTPLCRN